MAIRIEFGEFDQPPDFTEEINGGEDVGRVMDQVREWLAADPDELGQVRIIDTDGGAVLADVAVSVAGGSYELGWEGVRDLIREEASQYYGLAERKGGAKRTP